MLSRRRLLRLAGLAAAALAGGAWAGLARPTAPAAKLASVVRCRGAAADVGRAYLREHPEEGRPETLARLIDGPDLARLDGPRLRAAVRQQVRRDFEVGRTATVGGWMLSLTEARLCALCAIMA